MGAFLERRHLAVAHLVEDPAGVLVAEVVAAAALPVAQRTQGRRGQFRRERQRLQAREDAVAAEHRHEPRQARGRQALAARDRRREAQGGQVDEAAPVGGLERAEIALEARRIGDPLLEAALHVRTSLLAAAFVLRSRVGAAGTGLGGHDIDVGRPARVRLDPDLEGQAVLVEGGRRRGGDDGLALERFALVGQMEPAVLHPRCVGAQLLERVLDLEQVGEIAGGVDPDLQVDGLVLMVEIVSSGRVRTSVARRCLRHGLGGHDVEVGRPARVRLEPDVEGHAALVESGRRRGGDDGLALEGFALISQVELAVLHARGVGAELLEGILDLEQVGEVAGGVDPDLEVDGLVRWLRIVSSSWKPLPTARSRMTDSFASM